jgi:hypothetical protein
MIEALVEHVKSNPLIFKELLEYILSEINFTSIYLDHYSGFIDEVYVTFNSVFNKNDKIFLKRLQKYLLDSLTND